MTEDDQKGISWTSNTDIPTCVCVNISQLYKKNILSSVLII